MPRKGKMKPSGRSRPPRKSRNHKGNRQRRRGKARNGSSRPTLVLKAHALIAQNISGVNLKQINIAPSASVFGADIIAQFKYYQQYRISRVSIRFENLVPVGYQQGANVLQLPIVYQVPMINNQVPTAAQTAYLAYKNVKFFSYRSDFSRSFVPWVNVGTTQQLSFLRSPRLPTTNLDQIHYGLSFLFAKLSSTITTYTLRAVLTAQIQLYSYDGNQGVEYVPDPTLFVSPKTFNAVYDSDCDSQSQGQSSSDQDQACNDYRDNQLLQHTKYQQKREIPQLSQQKQQTLKLQIQQLQVQQLSQMLRKFQLLKKQVQLVSKGKRKHERQISLRTIQKNPGPEEQQQEPPDSNSLTYQNNQSL